MAMHVLVEPLPDGRGYRASTGAPMNFVANGATAEEALEHIGRQVADLWDRGARVYALPSLPPVRATPPTPVDEEMEQIFREELEKYRQRCDEEDRRRLEIQDAAPVA